MKKYLTLLKLQALSIIQYRTQVYAGIFTQFMFGLMRIFVMLSLFSSHKEPLPLNNSQVVTYIWMTQMLLTLIAWRPDPETGILIKEGTMAYELVRPMDISLAWLMRSLARRGFMPLMRGIPLCLITLLLPRPYRFEIGLTLHSLYLIPIVLLTTWLLAGVMNAMINIICLYLMTTTGLATMFPIIMMFFSGLILPVPLFPERLYSIVVLSPFIGLMDTPARIIIGVLQGDAALSALGVQLFWILTITLLNKTLLNFRLKSVTINGG